MKPALATVPVTSPHNTLQAQHAAIKQREASRSGPIWEPTLVARKPDPINVAIPIIDQLIAVIERPIEPGETYQAGHDRKEGELVMLLDTLTPVEALALRRRLANAQANDSAVIAFGRLVVNRRARLLAFLDDTRRRTAMRCR